MQLKGGVAAVPHKPSDLVSMGSSGSSEQNIHCSSPPTFDPCSLLQAHPILAGTWSAQW